MCVLSYRYISKCYETQAETYRAWDVTDFTHFSNDLLRINFGNDTITSFQIRDPQTFSNENLRLKFHPVECMSRKYALKGFSGIKSF